MRGEPGRGRGDWSGVATRWGRGPLPVTAALSGFRRVQQLRCCCSVNKRGARVLLHFKQQEKTFSFGSILKRQLARIPQFLEKSGRPSAAGAGQRARPRGLGQGLSRGPGCTRQLEGRRGDTSGGGGCSGPPLPSGPAGWHCSCWCQLCARGQALGRAQRCLSWGADHLPREGMAVWLGTRWGGVSRSEGCPGLGVRSGPLAQACPMLGSGPRPLGSAEALPLSPCLV